MALLKLDAWKKCAKMDLKETVVRLPKKRR